MKHDDLAAFVPLRFVVALRFEEIDGLHYLLGSYLAAACYEARSRNGGVVTIRIADLVELFSVPKLVNVSEETIRRKLHDLEPDWIECKTSAGKRAWQVRLTGLASPPQPALHWDSTLLDEESGG